MKHHVEEIGSSVIKEVKYDDMSQELEVKFPDGDWYRYSRVSKSEFMDMLNAGSVGRHFNFHIKPHKEYEKIDG